MPDPVRLLTHDEAAELLRVSTKTLQRLRGQGLPFVMLTSGTIRYRSDDLATFIDRRLQCHTAPKARASGTTTSRSGVVDFAEALARKTLKPPRR